MLYITWFLAYLDEIWYMATLESPRKAAPVTFLREAAAWGPTFSFSLYCYWNLLAVTMNLPFGAAE